MDLRENFIFKVSQISSIISDIVGRLFKLIWHFPQKPNKDFLWRLEKNLSISFLQFENSEGSRFAKFQSRFWPFSGSEWDNSLRPIILGGIKIPFLEKWLDDDYCPNFVKTLLSKPLGGSDSYELNEKFNKWQKILNFSLSKNYKFFFVKKFLEWEKIEKKIPCK